MSPNNASGGTGQRIYGTQQTGTNPGQPTINSTTSTTRNNLFDFGEVKMWPTRLREGLTEKLDSAKAKSDTKLGLVCEIMQSFSGIFLWILCFLSTIIVPVILFFLGLSNLDDCTERPCKLDQLISCYFHYMKLTTNRRTLQHFHISFSPLVS